MLESSSRSLRRRTGTCSWWRHARDVLWQAHYSETCDILRPGNIVLIIQPRCYCAHIFDSSIRTSNLITLASRGRSAEISAAAGPDRSKRRLALAADTHTRGESSSVFAEVRRHWLATRPKCLMRRSRSNLFPQPYCIPHECSAGAPQSELSDTYSPLSSTVSSTLLLHHGARRRSRVRSRVTTGAPWIATCSRLGA
jgi:hypothetical protein